MCKCWKEIKQQLSSKRICLQQEIPVSSKRNAGKHSVNTVFLLTRATFTKQLDENEAAQAAWKINTRKYIVM